MKTETRYWLMKSEPESYSIGHLKKDRKTAWNGVRNYQARNFMRDMKIGDQILFYHSNCKVMGVYGVAKVASAPYPDPTQFDPKSHYFDTKATKAKPIWDLVDIAYVSMFKEPVTLIDIRATPSLKSMIILQTGSRLSVTPVDPAHFNTILALAKRYM
ncbi:MAG: RNA-binding protein [Parcubacteria bacterium C7867-004]|nr:MAG: RNA-binding protein [Parcubacteria bacterium C7867-004]